MNKSFFSLFFLGYELVMSNVSITTADLKEILWVKCQLLCLGVNFSADLIDSLESKGITLGFVRKGGAGPAAGRYFKFINGSIANIPVWLNSQEITPWEIENVDVHRNVQIIHRDLKKKILTPLALIPSPQFYQKVNSQGIPYRKIALMHGNTTLATTIYQTCRYWHSNQQCQFCGIEFSLRSGDTIAIKTGNQIVETIRAAREENSEYAVHLTLTSGTEDSTDKGMARYCEILREIRKEFPELPIHIQVEPMQDPVWYDRVYAAGATTIGIHLEIIDDAVRAQVCPGKAHIPRSLYYDHWRKAVNIFGKNQVSTFILTGYESQIKKFKEGLKSIVDCGVLPLLTPTRFIPGVIPAPPRTSPELFLDLTLYTARLLYKKGLDPTQNKAGCILCGGCSALLDAYSIVLGS